VVRPRGKRADWLDRHPGPEDVAMVVEVADSTLEDDRAMVQTYGSGVPVYWLVNVRDGQIEAYTGPSGSSEPIGYRQCDFRHPGETATLMLECREVARIPVADLLPQATTTSN
jgi:Uma2 family endonuclease